MVGDFEFTIDGKSAVPIVFGKSNDNSYDFTIAKEAIVDGATLKSPSKLFSISLTIGSDHYVCNPKHPECADVQITRSKNRVEFVVNSRLFNPDTGKVIDSRDVLVLEGENYSLMGLD